MAVALELERSSRLAAAGLLVEAQARRVVSSIMERAGTAETLRTVSTKQFLEDWLAAKIATKAEGTSTKYQGVVRAFLGELGPRAARPIASLVAADFQRFLTARLQGGSSKSTARLDVKILGGAFASAVRQGLIPSNPATQIELPTEDGNVREVFSAQEVRQLLEAATGEWRLLVLLGYMTGQRLMDLATLTWDQVDLVRGVIRFRQQKTGTRLEVPIHADLRAALEAAAGDVGGPVLPGLSKASQTGRRGLSEQFKAIVREAGLDTGQTEAANGRKFNSRTFHSLRHSFTSELANAGVAEEVRMRLTGHRSKDQHAKYSHLELESVAAAVAKLPSMAEPAAAKKGGSRAA